ncbi:hypothetical protein NE237_027761 [Protea cynaroides]|uniref:Uncharacterized protein n=1 Tax=Protea cynaroides TaxID=273540 RepID=A0A9Q0JS88_9MAGN|nr:hypothetical protein NE237_027761 [Protea cynaroides]
MLFGECNCASTNQNIVYRRELRMQKLFKTLSFSCGQSIFRDSSNSSLAKLFLSKTLFFSFLFPVNFLCSSSLCNIIVNEVESKFFFDSDRMVFTCVFELYCFS